MEEFLVNILVKVVFFFFYFSHNSEVSWILLWVWWVSLFSFSFLTVFNNWFLIRRHISLSGLDLSHIQHFTAPINLHRALWLICASCIICPIMLNCAKVKITKKITCIGSKGREKKHLIRWETGMLFLKCILKFWLFRNQNALFFAWQLFLYSQVWSFVKEWKYVTSCSVLKQSEHEMKSPLPLAVLDSLRFGVLCPLPNYLIFSYFPWGSFFLYFICWL